ncbi:hypothetical protein J4734_28320 [Klebsiella pneumoniae]|uniref:Uncharacterized protein n=1 Tax=Klebsiella pneumoniae TaxID=573 RepID=A0A939SSS5_KLEPN|nr:hypothetical protein [Klebsiella pneumoniae]
MENHFGKGLMAGRILCRHRRACGEFAPTINAGLCWLPHRMFENRRPPAQRPGSGDPPVAMASTGIW